MYWESTKLKIKTAKKDIPVCQSPHLKEGSLLALIIKLVNCYRKKVDSRRNEKQP